MSQKTKCQKARGQNMYPPGKIYAYYFDFFFKVKKEIGSQKLIVHRILYLTQQNMHVRLVGGCSLGRLLIVGTENMTIKTAMMMRTTSHKHLILLQNWKSEKYHVCITIIFSLAWNSDQYWTNILIIGSMFKARFFWYMCITS